EARFQVTPAALAKLAELKTTRGEPVVSPKVVDKLGPLADGVVITAPVLKERLRGVLDEQEFSQYISRIYDAVPAPDSATLGGINFRFGVIVVVSGLVATLLGGMAGDRLRARGVRAAYFHVAGWGVLAAVPFFIAMLYVPFPLAWAMIFIAVFGLF